MAIASINPATGETEQTFAAHSADEVDARIAEASSAYRTLRDTTFAQRAEWMQAAADALAADVDMASAMLTREMGKPLAQARAVGKPVSVCGEMAGDPAFSEVLLAMGLRSFSMHPSQIASIKEKVLQTDTQRWSAWLERVLAADDPEQACRVAKAACETNDEAAQRLSA